MTRSSAILASVLGAATAAAAPSREVALPSGHCRVTVAQAPEPVAGTIQEWADGELHCKTSLVVRVFPVANGLAIVATDEAGRVRYRVVPDADAAGVLVASWIADDAPPASSSAAAAVEAEVAVAEPGGEVAVRVPPPSAAMQPPELRFDVIAMSGINRVNSAQIRLWLERRHANGWAFLAGAQLEEFDDFTANTSFLGAVFGASHTHDLDGWYVREQGGVGAQMSIDPMAKFGFLLTDVELAAGAQLGPRVAIEASVVWQANLQTSLSSAFTALGIGGGMRVAL